MAEVFLLVYLPREDNLAMITPPTYIHSKPKLMPSTVFLLILELALHGVLFALIH